MRIAVLGVGGVGGYLAGRLAAGGSEVALIARGAHAAAMRQDGLRVVSPLGDLHLRTVAVHECPEEAGPADIVLVAVKMYDLDAAAAAVRPLVGEHTAVVPFQNGVEAMAILERALGRGPVCGGVAYIAAVIERPGVIRHNGPMARFLFGAPEGRHASRLEALAAACRAAGVEAVHAPAIEVEIWRKFIFLAPFAGITCLARAPIGQVRDDPALWRRFAAMVRETAAVARAQGVPLPDDIEADRIGVAQAQPAATKSSMLQDLEAGRRLELDWLQGAVVRLGERLGVPVPATREVYDALAAFRHGAPAG